jgi:hypothetical protein
MRRSTKAAKQMQRMQRRWRARRPATLSSPPKPPDQPFLPGKSQQSLWDLSVRLRRDAITLAGHPLSRTATIYEIFRRQNFVITSIFRTIFERHFNLSRTRHRLAPVRGYHLCKDSTAEDLTAAQILTSPELQLIQ